MVYTPSGNACGNCRPRLDRLLIERIGLLVNPAETFGADWSEAARRRGLKRHEPPERSEADLDIPRHVSRKPGLDQSLRKPSIVVSENAFKPEPILALICEKQRHQPVAQQLAHAVRKHISVFQCAISVQTQEREGPGAWRRELLDNGKGGLEKCRGPRAAGRIGVRACAFPQSPKRPGMAVFRARLFQPSPVIPHKISEPTRVRIPCVLNESCKSRRVYFRSQLRCA